VFEQIMFEQIMFEQIMFEQIIRFGCHKFDVRNAENALWRRPLLKQFRMVMFAGASLPGVFFTMMKAT
jgi:hypothetical protein